MGSSSDTIQGLKNPVISKETYVNYVRNISGVEGMETTRLPIPNKFKDKMNNKNLSSTERKLIGDIDTYYNNVEKELKTRKKDVSFNDLYNEAEQRLKAFKLCQYGVKTHYEERQEYRFPNALLNLDKVKTPQKSKEDLSFHDYIFGDDFFDQKERKILWALSTYGFNFFSFDEKFQMPRSNYIVKSYVLRKDDSGETVKTEYTCKTKLVNEDNEHLLTVDIMVGR